MNKIATDNVRNRIIVIYGLLAAANLGVWVWAIVAFHKKPILLGTAFLAYTFGLRHAVDADHIAAIDNVTRKLMQDGNRPVSVGFLLCFRAFDHRLYCRVRRILDCFDCRETF
jgi:nickel/cobalt transporter (NiCoT) family protein